MSEYLWIFLWCFFRIHHHSIQWLHLTPSPISSNLNLCSEVQAMSPCFPRGKINHTSSQSVPWIWSEHPTEQCRKGIHLLGGWDPTNRRLLQPSYFSGLTDPTWLVVTGTWLAYFFIQLGMSSSQLTNSYFSEGSAPQPHSYPTEITGDLLPTIRGWWSSRDPVRRRKRWAKRPGRWSCVSTAAARCGKFWWVFVIAVGSFWVIFCRKILVKIKSTEITLIYFFRIGDLRLMWYWFEIDVIQMCCVERRDLSIP